MFKSIAAILGIGYFLLGAPVAVDAPFGWGRRIGVALIFLAWVMALLEIGDGLLAKLNFRSDFFTHNALKIGLGSAFAALWAFALAHLHLLKTPSPFFWAVAFFGVALLFSRVKRDVTPALSWSRSEKIVFGIATFCFLLGLIPGFKILSNGDALYYHLFGPREWFDQGGAYLDLHVPVVYLNGIWEYLYLWPHFLMGGSPGMGLVGVQHFSQWTQYTLAVGGSVLGLISLIQSETDPKIRDLKWAVLAAVSASFMEINTGIHAGNDWASLVWIIAGVIIWVQRPRQKFSGLLLGFFFGMAFVAKYTSAFAIFGFTLFLLFRYSLWKRIWFFAGGFLLGGAPIFLRNGLSAGDPIYPTFTQFFPSSWITHTFQQAVLETSGVTSVSALPIRIFAMLGRSPFLWISLLLPMILIFSKEFRKSGFPQCMAALWLGLAIFLFKGTTEARYSLPLEVPLAALGFASLSFAVNYVVPRQFKGLALAATFIWALSVTSIPLYAIAQIAKGYYSTSDHQVVSDITGGELKYWMRSHPQLFAGQLTLMGDCEHYYVSQFPVTCWETDPELEPKLLEIQNGPSQLKVLRAANIRYFVSTLPAYDVDVKVTPHLLELAEKNPASIVYRVGNQEIVDLSLIPN